MGGDVALLLQSNSTCWAIAIMLGFPILIVVLGEAIQRLRRRRMPLASTLRIIRDLVVPALAVELLFWRVLELSPSSWTLRIIQTGFWIVSLHAGLSFVNDVVFASAAAGTWQSRVPKLFLDLARTLLVLVGGAIVLSTVWGFDLARLATALGVGSIVIGLALQEPMGNLFAGLILLFERPLSPGDWIAVDGVTGKVVELNWRSVHLETSTRELRIVPNSALYKGSFSNLSRPNKLRTEVVELEFSCDDQPNKVKRVVLDTLKKIEGVLADPAPSVRTVGYGESAIKYRVVFTVTSQESLAAARDEFMTRIWYIANRHGLHMPVSGQAKASVDKAEIDREHPGRTADLLRDFPQFAQRDDEGDRVSLGTRAIVRTFAKGECVVMEGEGLDGLHLILEGEAALGVRDRTGADREIARVGRGEYFGEQAILSSKTSELTARAIEDLVVLIIDVESLGRLLDRMPRLGREIGGLMEVRRKSAQSARKVAAASG